ncbi:MAG: threonine synthase [Candidatus Thorarchaeota archaeon]|nr:MAG: threonine synthase [Candidatus Thorarchaeota archaeon]
MISHISHLECPQCGRKHSAEMPATYCLCGTPLFARYDMRGVVEAIESGEFPSSANSMWRYSELLPVKSPSFVVSLGEGWTPLLLTRRLGTHLGLRMLRIKDEAKNPTLSFKDRGLCAAISKHLEMGVDSFALPSAGNAAVSMSAYCAASGTSAHAFMPEDTPQQFIDSCRAFGAEVILVEGTIVDAAAEMQVRDGGWTDLSTTKEPYRVEGKKTMAFEIAEQMGWTVPDVVICPTGGGTSLIGIWKGFEELETLGLIDDRRPRMYAVQSGGCAPVVRAFERGTEEIEAWPRGETRAYGLRVPKPFADRLMMKVIQRSGGGAVAATDSEIESCQWMAARLEGLDFCPEAAIGLAGLRNLVDTGVIDYDEDVVLLNTGSSSRYGGIPGRNEID